MDWREWKVTEEQAVAMIMTICELTGHSAHLGDVRVKYRHFLEQVKQHKPLRDDEYGD